MFEKIKNLLLNFKNFFSGKVKNNSGLTFSLLVYFLLVFWNFFKQGLVNWDEARFVVIARTFSIIIKGFLLNPLIIFDKSFLVRLMADYGFVNTYARPSYIFLSSLLGVIIPYEYSTRLLGVFSGALAVIFFYRLLGLYGFNERLRTAGTILLALSPLFLLYSRLGLSQIFSAAWLVVSLFYLIRFYKTGIKKDLIKFSLSWSILFMSHYNVILFCFILLLYGAWAVWKKGDNLKNWLSYIIYLSALPLLWEIITRIGAFISGYFLPPENKILTYSQEFFHQISLSKNTGFSAFTQPWYYFELLWRSESLVFILAVLGLLVVLKNIKKFEYQAVFIPFSFSFLLFIYGSIKFPRSLISVLPVFYFLAFFGFYLIFSFLEKKLKNKKILLIVLLAIFIIPHSWRYVWYLNLDGGTKQAADYVKANYKPEETLIVSWHSGVIWRGSLFGYKSENLPNLDNLEEILKNRPHILIIHDYFSDMFGEYELKDEWEKIRFPSNIFNVRPVIMDFEYWDKKSLEKTLLNNKKSETIIYEYRR